MFSVFFLEAGILNIGLGIVLILYFRNSGKAVSNVVISVLATVVGDILVAVGAFALAWTILLGRTDEPWPVITGSPVTLALIGSMLIVIVFTTIANYVFPTSQNPPPPIT